MRAHFQRDLEHMQQHILAMAQLVVQVVQQCVDALNLRQASLAEEVIRGDATGRLKIIFHRETKKVLGVHIIGEGACELIHIGQAVMIFGGTAEYFVDTVFNYPTLAECYKAAAFNGLNKLSKL